jgi:pimeloyl-ACP methyl ester carboxylesterase
MESAARELGLDANGLHFRALEWAADPRAATALLLHATSFCADAWKPAWAAARAHGAVALRGVAIDQRGHGQSDAPGAPADYAWTRLAADAVALAGVLAPGAGVIGVGHSSGATSLLAAAGLAPERFAALVAVEPVLFDASGETGSFLGSGFLAGAARRRRDRFASREEARARLCAKPPMAGFDAAVVEAILDGALAPAPDGGVALRCPGEREAWCYEGSAALDLWPLVGRIRAPLLLVLGEHTAVAPRFREQLLAALPSASIETIAGGTHFAALERPREVGTAIGGFVAELAL